MKPPPVIHVISHGPHCLDGMAAAVSVARYYHSATVIPHFATNTKIDEVIRSLSGSTLPPGSEIWITDISWTHKETDDHLRDLARQGTRIYWFDHHRTAIQRYRAGEVDVPFAGHVVSEEYAASRLVYEYLHQRLAAEGRVNEKFQRFRRVVEMADDNDRWLHTVEGSRQLSLTIRALAHSAGELAGYDDLLDIDENVTYTSRMQKAYERAEEELRRSREVAEQSRVLVEVPGSKIVVVAAVCDGYPSEIADQWGKDMRQAVFAFFDTKSLGVSLRRSPDCPVDLSRLAEAFGGGGHPAAAGAEIPELRRHIAEAMARLMTPVVRSLWAVRASSPDNG